MTVAGAVELDSVAVNHGEFDVTREGDRVAVPGYVDLEGLRRRTLGEPCALVKLKVEEEKREDGVVGHHQRHGESKWPWNFAMC